ncbi:MAG: hypothetical protein IKK33_03300 [Lachnospiraceae bacterium]|nr:hypothetical protein [Lachnospiraceae bacterium]
MLSFENCLFIEGEDAIKEHFRDKKEVLLIAGKGFDPRATKGLECIRDEISSLSVCIVDYEDRGVKENKLHESRSEENIKRIKELSKGIELEIKKVPQYSKLGNSKVLVISESVRENFDEKSIQKYKHIIIDISAMPRAVVFSLIKRITKIKNETQKVCIMVCENSEWDEKINPVIVEESAEYLQGFNTFSMSQDNSIEQTIWIPMLGMNEENAFEIIYNFLDPIEICPVVPFPSTDIHRGEAILRYYGETLFRVHNIDKRNIIYVPENHPLLIYRKLYDTVRYYEKALGRDTRTTDGYKYAFSSQSSKLIDLGMLLAILHLENQSIKAGIVVVENQGYSSNEEYLEENNKLYCLCLDDEIFGW